MQQPSSLIFLAIVVIWAAYLLQHWIRRREALATARSADQFSDAMRVLERREHRTGIDGLAEQAAETPEASRPSAPQARASAPRPSLRAGTVMTGETQPTAGSPAEKRTPAPSPTAAETPEVGAVQRFTRTAATAGSPKLRAMALILSVSILLITIVCAPFGALPWWSPVFMLAVSGGVFYWCRISAMAAAAARRPAGGSRPQPVSRRSAPRKAAPQQADAHDHRGGVKLPKRKTTPAATPVPVTKSTMPAPQAQAPAPQPPGEQVFDVSASSAAPAPATGPAPVEHGSAPVEPVPAPAGSVAEPVAQDGDAWQPVAVPPPTYTMKERAPERPQQAPAPTSNPKSYEHVANEDLPFDGLALDQDLDDLPSVFRAG